MNLKEELCKFLNNECFHLGRDTATMSELNGIGALYIPNYELRDKTIEFMKTLGVNVHLEGCIAYRNILFYSDDYKSEIEEGTETIDFNWGRVATRVMNEYLCEKYNVEAFENDYWYSLSPTCHKCVISQRFKTFGSEIGGDRRVEIVETIRELEEFELMCVKKPDLELIRAEKELYYWYMSREKDNFTSILYTLIAKSDIGNREKLRAGFPKEVEVMTKFQNELGYWDALKTRVEERMK